MVPPPGKRDDETFWQVNDAFHARYEEARDPARLTVPVVVLLGDDLVFVHRGDRKTFRVTPRSFHVIKSIAHAPIALYAAMRPADGHPPGDLDALHERVARARDSARDGLEHEATDELRADVDHVLGATLAVIEHARALTEERAREEALEAFAADMRAALLRLTEAATRLQLDALHATVETVVAGLDPGALAHLQVVVAGQHQARARSLGMQYFAKRFGEKEGDEHRVAYAEGAGSVDDALVLVATRRLDNVVARAFFGDPHRLQQDVLGDAVADLLRRRDWPLL